MTYYQYGAPVLTQVRDLRKRSEGIPDEHLVCLVGDMITEEAVRMPQPGSSSAVQR